MKTRVFIKTFGAVAQLVERLLCKQDVSGSSPLTSTDYHLLHNFKKGNF